ncbi:MAG: carboxypeptidase regulatory-like domain-containing protein, partial [Pseudolabrys sp.]
MCCRTLVIAVSWAFASLVSGPAPAQTSTALTGLVSSAENNAMEGVLVSASKTGSPVTVTVVTGKDGRFFFPVSKLAPGQYSLGVRAVGYDLDAPKAIEITEQKTTTADLPLRKTEDLAAQLSNGEWLASIPGTDQQKGQLLNCVGCHTLERIVRSKYDANAFLTQVLPRMQGYVNQSIPAAPQLRRGERRMEERGDQRVQVYRGMADFLGGVNLSSGPQWNYALKTLPRPKGRSTRVVITEYDLPRETIQPHDVVIDADGIAWYSSFGEQFLGRLDPKTGKASEYPVPMHKPGFPTGFLGLRTDK